MSATVSIQHLLLGKRFRIPVYQRDFSWTTDQVNDLLNDIQEVLDTATTHYMGTVVLAQDPGNVFEVVDGQQRLTAITLVVHALLGKLDPTDAQRITDTAILLVDGQAPRLDLSANAQFLGDLVAGASPTPETPGQRKLASAYHHVLERARSLLQVGGTILVKRWLEVIKTLEVIQFVAPGTGQAIRMFQTVNDRGLPLSAMDKAKALLVFYSNRHLGGKLDGAINDCFGRCFRAFDAARELAGGGVNRVDNIARDNFSEDDLLRYHYLSYAYSDAVQADDYRGTVYTVYEAFLKGTLKLLAKDPARLDGFVQDYIRDLAGFASAFADLAKGIASTERLYKDFVVLGLSARLYPLAIRLQQRGELLAAVPRGTVDLLYCLEVADVRVYKTRGTDPAMDIGRLSHMSRSASVSEIADGLRSFVSHFMPDGNFDSQLSLDMYRNDALPYLLLEYDESVAGAAYSLQQLQDRVRRQISREHIISQAPSFNVTSHGFADEEDFRRHVDCLGNLTALTKSKNSKCNNVAVHTKMTDPDLYAASIYAGTRALTHQYAAGNGAFGKAEIAARGDSLKQWVLKRWALR